MIGKLYLMGYTGRTIQEVTESALALGAAVVDIRIRPYSRHTQWNKHDLWSALNRGGVDYLHMAALGNVNYNAPEKPIALLQPERGARDLYDLLYGGRSAILLCACERSDECHRTTVADLMRAKYGVLVKDLGNPIGRSSKATGKGDNNSAPQLELFG